MTNTKLRFKANEVLDTVVLIEADYVQLKIIVTDPLRPVMLNAAFTPENRDQVIVDVYKTEKAFRQQFKLDK